MLLLIILRPVDVCILIGLCDKYPFGLGEEKGLSIYGCCESSPSLDRKHLQGIEWREFCLGFSGLREWTRERE
ncbi:hypothetical protein VNO77_04168 [Canavalia gladiata]|uniref:Uncharacterized protein n=1 Tax=Canavalia gladiata TaxID=3824 RepID=A0AAN9N169_CANGL